MSDIEYEPTEECAKCGAILDYVKNKKQIDYTLAKFGEIICYNCQVESNT